MVMACCRLIIVKKNSIDDTFIKREFVQNLYKNNTKFSPNLLNSNSPSRLYPAMAMASYSPAAMVLSTQERHLQKKFTRVHCFRVQRVSNYWVFQGQQSQFELWCDPYSISKFGRYWYQFFTLDNIHIRIWKLEAATDMVKAYPIYIRSVCTPNCCAIGSNQFQ